MTISIDLEVLGLAGVILIFLFSRIFYLSSVNNKDREGMICAAIMSDAIGLILFAQLCKGFFTGTR